MKKFNALAEPSVSYDGMTQRKVAIVLVGSSASGKTTLRRQLTKQDEGTEKRSFMKDCLWQLRYSCCGQVFDKKHLLERHVHSAPEAQHEAKRGAYMSYETKYTLFKNGTGLCGHNGKLLPDGSCNPGTGSDSNGNPEANMAAFDHALMERDVVIYDGVMLPDKFVGHLQSHVYPNLVFVFAFLNVSLENTLKRLAERRERNEAEPANEKTLKGVEGYWKSARQRWERLPALFTRQPVEFVVIPDGSTPEESAKLVRKAVGKVFDTATAGNGPNGTA